MHVTSPSAFWRRLWAGGMVCADLASGGRIFSTNLEQDTHVFVCFLLGIQVGLGSRAPGARLPVQCRCTLGGGFGVWSGRSGLVWSVFPPLVAGRLSHAEHAFGPLGALPSTDLMPFLRATVACEYSFGSSRQVLQCVKAPSFFFVLPKGRNSARFLTGFCPGIFLFFVEVLPVLPSHLLWAFSLLSLFTGSVWERGFRCPEGGNAVCFSDRIFSGVRPFL